MDPKRRRRYLQIAFGFGALVVAIVFLHLLRAVLGACVRGAPLAFLIQPAVIRLVALGIPRVLAIVIIFLLIIVVIGGLALLIVPLGAREVGQLQRQIPSLAAAAQDRINSLQGSPINILGINIDVKGTTDSINAHLKDYLLGQFGNAVTIGLTALTTLLQVVLMFIVAVLLPLDAASFRRVLRRLVPSDYRTDFDQIWRKVRKMLYAYVRGQLIIAGLIGILSGIACLVLGLPDAGALGLIAGITALIPYLGPFIGAVPAILVGLSQGTGKAVLVAILYFGISNLI